jgi:hypothetical protein
MKYDFLVKKKCKNTSEETSNDKGNLKNNESLLGSTMLSTYEDFNIFLKKTHDIIEINNDKSNQVNKDIEQNDNETNENETKKDKHIGKNENETKKDKHIGKNDNSTLFESEKKTVETIVKYSSSFINLLLKFMLMLKNAFIHLLLKKKINNESIKDKEIIDKFNKQINKKNKHIEKKDNKHNERKDKNNEKRDKHSERKDYKQIKKINSYLLELD